MSKNIRGPRALGAFKPDTMQTPAGRAGHLDALCAAARRRFEVRGDVGIVAWVWVQQTPDGASAPAILAIELEGEITEARHDAFDARVVKACELGKALAVATVTEHAFVQILFESYAGSEVHSAPIRSGSDPLLPGATRRVLDAFGPTHVDPAPERFRRFLHAPLRS